MRIFRALASICFAVAAAAAQPVRPAITGISHMCVYAANMQASDNFYGRILGGLKGSDPIDTRGTRYYFSPTQFVEVLPLPSDHGISRMACVAYNTADAAGLLAYMRAKGVEGLGEVRTASDGSRWFQVKDPEGNLVRLVQPGRPISMGAAQPISTRMIHVGYLVHNRQAEDRFYKEVLGFRPYWFGAKQPDHVDWVSQQTPDGRDWLEYMMVGDGSDVPPERVDERQLGVLNHFSLGVVNMEKAVTTLYAEDRLSPRHDGPSMGLDGKWQANLYDPDGTRVELMEFQPVSKPCCSAFTGGEPGEVVRSRRAWALCLAAIVAFGLASRTVHTGFSLIDKYPGDALYAAMAYVILRLIWPGKAVAWAAMGVMTAIELFQLTLIPAHLLGSPHLLVRICARLMGTEFSFLDLLAYAVGIGCIRLVDRRC